MILLLVLFSDSIAIIDLTMSESTEESDPKNHDEMDGTISEQIKMNERFIQELKANQVNKEIIHTFSVLFSKSIVWNGGSIHDTIQQIQLENILLAIFNYCQNSHDSELIDELLGCYSVVLNTLFEVSLKRNTELKDCMEEVFQRVVSEIFHNNVHFKITAEEGDLNIFELCQIKMNDDIKILLAKLLNILLSMINKMTVKLPSDFNVIFVFMLHKMNELLLQEQNKILSITLYMNVIEYFHETLQDKVVIDYLNGILFQDKQLDLEIKFSIIIFLFDQIASYYLINATSANDGNINQSDHSLELECFYKHLKEFSLEQLPNMNPSIRKSALYIIKRMYSMEYDGQTQGNKTLENFFHMFETLEESQVNLITPVVEQVGSCDNLVLRKILLARMLQYENVSIIRVAIERLHLLNNDLDIIVSLLDITLKALNNSSLFVPESEGVRNSLVKLFELLNKPYAEGDHYLNLIKSIMCVPWGPVPLFYVTHYLQLASSDVKPTITSTQECLSKITSAFKIVTNLIQVNFKHNLIIRSGIDFCLRKHIVASLISPIKQMDIGLNSTGLVEVINNFLNICRPNSDKTNEFRELLEGFAKVFSYDKDFIYNYINEHFITEHNQVQESSFNTIALFLLSDKINPTEFIDLIKQKLKHSSESFENLAKIKAFIVQYGFLCPLLCCTASEASSEGNCCFIHSFLSLNYTEDQFKTHLSQILENRDVEKYGDTIEFLITYSSTVESFVKTQLLNSIVDISKQEFGVFNNEYNYLFILNLYLEKRARDCHEHFMQNEQQLNGLFNANNFFNCKDRKSVELKLKLFKRICQNKIVNGENQTILLELFIFNELCIECLSNTSRDCLLVILDIMKLLIPRSLIEEDKHGRGTVRDIIIKFIGASYKEVQSLKKTTLFTSNMKAWINTTFQHPLVDILDTVEYHTIVMQCIVEILEHEESSSYLFERLAILIDRETGHCKICASFLQTLFAKGLLYGNILKKDILTERAVCEYIRQNTMGYDASPRFHYSGYIRYLSTASLPSHNDIDNPITSAKNSQLDIVAFMDDLKEAFDSKQTSVQYFHNSQTHRIKLRAIQNILLLDDAADKILLELKALSVKQNLFVWGLENVLKYNHQPSVRYYLEWLIIRNLVPMKHFRKDIFWTFFAQAYDERPGSIVSFLSIIYHVSRRIITLRSTEDHTEKQLKFIDEAMEQLISCSMSQLFNLRLYANVVFLKLYDNLTGESWSELRKKYEMVFKAMMKTKSSAKGEYNVRLG